MFDTSVGNLVISFFTKFSSIICPVFKYLTKYSQTCVILLFERSSLSIVRRYVEVLQRSLKLLLVRSNQFVIFVKLLSSGSFEEFDEEQL